MNGKSGGPAVILERVFYGSAALCAVTFVVAAILDGYEAEVQMRDGNIFTPHGVVFLVLAIVSMIGGLVVTFRKR